MSLTRTFGLCGVSDSGNALLSPPKTAAASVGQWGAITVVLLTSFFAGTASAQQAPVEYRIERIPVDDGSWSALLETAEAVGISKDEILRIVGN